MRNLFYYLLFVLVTTITSVQASDGYKYLKFTVTSCENYKLLELSWLSGAENFPTSDLTSNNSGGVIVSGDFSGLNYRAFDGDITNANGLWIGDILLGDPTKEILLDLGSVSISPTHFRIHKDGWGYLNGFKCEGSNDGTSWELLLENNSSSEAWTDSTFKIIYNLDLTATNGSIIKSPDKVSYMKDEIVTLTASPNTGYQFDNWSGDATGVSQVTSTVMDDDKSITANFSVISGTSYPLTVDSGDGDGDYVEGSIVVISASQAPEGKTFYKWTGDIATITNVNLSNTTIEMPDRAVSIAATYLQGFQLQETASLFVNSKENHIYISNFIDLDGGEQNITFTYFSRNESVVSVIGVDYSSPNSIATLKVQEKGVIGSAYVIVEFSDGNNSFTDSVLVSVGNYDSPGMTFQIHDVMFWQQAVPLNSDPVFDTILHKSEGLGDNYNYDHIPITVSDECSSAYCTGADFFTTFFKGILIPPVDGDYTFFIKSNNHKGFWFSGDDNYDNAVNLIHTSKNIGDSIAWDEWKSSTQTLQAGKPYAFYATQWIVHSKSGGVLMEGPGISKDYIDGQYMMPIYDPIKPSIVTGLKTLVRTSDKINIAWEEATDNQKVSGYRVYVNGILFNSELISELTAEITGLSSGSNFSIIVTSVDQMNNESLSSVIHNESTYPVDSTPPTPPTSLETLTSTGVAAHLKWTGATDNEAVIGYNLYIDGVKYNKNDYIYSDEIIVYGLLPLSSFKTKIEAIDASYNVSELSAEFIFETAEFDPFGPSLGEKIARAKIIMENITWNEGIGINGPYENGSFVYNSTVRDLVKEMQPGTIRWGGIEANSKSLAGSTGTGKENTYGQMLSFANEMGCKFSLTVGVQKDLDYMKDTATFTNLLEYLAGSSETTWGAIRASEGFTEPLLQESSGILIEFGNEVWGGTSHQAEIGSNYSEYTRWCREVTAVIKASPYYDSTMITMVYSGRNPHPDDSYGLTQKVLSNDDGELECLALSGYLGGNLDYDPEVPQGDSELEYYQYRSAQVEKNLIGFVETMRIAYDKTGSIKPFYLYESNMTTPVYNGRLGQAAMMTDYMAQSIEYGSMLPSLFHLNHGEWKIVRTGDEVVRLPLYNMAKYYNTYCKGHVLKTELETSEYLVDGAGYKISLPPVGVYAYNNGTEYSILLMGRDFENDFTIQLDLPDEFTSSTLAKKYIISGDNFSTVEASIDSVTDLQFGDSLLVEVPKYSMVLITFTGDDQGFTQLPLGFYNETYASSIEIIPENVSAITENEQKIYFSTIVNPSDALILDVEWEVVDPQPSNMAIPKIGHTIAGKFYMKGSGCSNGNGTVTLRAKSKRTPSVYTDLEVDISNQDGAYCETSIDANSLHFENWFYPNPALNQLTINNPFINNAVVSVYDIAGNKIIEEQINGESLLLDLSILQKGVYIVNLSSNDRVLFGKLIKE